MGSKGKEEEEGEGIPLKQMNEYRRSNRMELLTKEQHEARKAVIRGKNQKAEEAVRRKSAQTQSNQTERLSTQSSSDTQLPSGANGMSAEDLERIEAKKKNLESARDFQRIANEEYHKEKAEIENQTGEQINLSIVSPSLAGADERSNLSQTQPDQSVSNQNQNKVLSDIRQQCIKPNSTISLQIALLNQGSSNRRVIKHAPLNTSLGEVSDKRSDRTAEGVQSVLNRQDVLDIAITNQVKKKKPLSLMNTPVTGWEDGHDDLSDMLQGHTHCDIRSK